MKYRYLMQYLQWMTDEQLDLDVTVKTDDSEFLPVEKLCFDTTDGVLDDGHPYLVTG